MNGSTETRFLYEGDQLIGEYNASNQLLRRYVPGPGDEVASWYEGAGTSDRRYLVTDRQGSVISVTNAAGTVLGINSYDEAGIGAAGNLGRFQYDGEPWLSEIGLYNLQARAYSPFMGRFMQTDPIQYEGGANWYAYGDDDPVNKSDPTGHGPGEEIEQEAEEIAEEIAESPLGQAAERNLAKAAERLEDRFGVSKPAQVPANDTRFRVPDPEVNAELANQDGLEASERASLIRAERSLARNVLDHQQKLADYRRDPDSVDNQGRLAAARSAEERQRIIDGREASLQKQIEKNKGELEKVRKRLKPVGLPGTAQ